MKIQSVPDARSFFACFGNRSMRCSVSYWACLLVVLSSSTSVAQTASIADCQQLFSQGKYEECIASTNESIRTSVGEIEEFVCLKAQSEFILGKYEEAWQSLLTGLTRVPTSLRFRWMMTQIGPYVGRDPEAQMRKQECAHLIRTMSWRYSQKDHDLVTLSQIVLNDGADPRQIQTILLKRAKDLHPDSPVPIQAIGELALEKRDLALATETFREALKKFPEDPEFHFGLARALADADPKGRQTEIERTLVLNPRHIGSLLLQAEHLIDGERYDQARVKLEEILAINKHHPVALSYMAVLSFLKEDIPQFEAFREQALSKWKTNPEVDYQLGKKLSQKYRFEDGAAAQRRALIFQPDHLPAMRQLSQDLLRLGREEEGWKLAHQVHKADEYDISSFNLVTLHDELRKYTVIERPGWRIRMEKREAEIYGDRVLKLLNEARASLCEKYDIPLQKPISVEIFPKPSDFAVRTFGMPGAGGYLGVCFGDVVTALSPAAREASPVNWESVLWHELAHVITLNKTHNRMPRWLSEGISVYEERQRDSRWGERMTPEYRQCILQGRMTPIHRMSEAFLPPGNSCGIMFAYFQSSLVVEYLVETYGQPALLAILEDLAVGIPINDAIERHTTSMGELEENFSKAMVLKAKYYGWSVDWSPFKLELITSQADPTTAILDWARRNPRHYNGLKTCGQMLARLDQKTEAMQLLQQAVWLYPLETGPQSAAALLAELQRGVDDQAERETLLQWTNTDQGAATGLLRLIELDTQRKDWPEVMSHAQRLLEIKPLISPPYTALAAAAEELQQHEAATAALQTLLKLPSVDPADLHYRLAVQYRDAGELTQSRRQTLQALEIAPRYREALILLLELQGTDGSAP